MFYSFFYFIIEKFLFGPLKNLDKSHYPLFSTFLYFMQAVIILTFVPLKFQYF